MKSSPIDTVMNKPLKYTNCPHCGELLVMSTNYPNTHTMFIRVRCCDTYANVKWRDEK